MKPDPVLAFCRAACTGDLEGADAVLAAHPDLTSKSIVAAAVRGDMDALAVHLELDPSGATARVAGRWPLLALMAWSAYGGRSAGDQEALTEGAGRLLDAGASPADGIEDDDLPGGTRTPLAAAVTRGYVPLCDLLLERGAPARDGASLFLAAAARNPEILQRLLARGASLNEPDADQLPLHWVLDVMYERDAVEDLLRAGADPNLAVGPRDETALHVAARRRRAEILRPLVEAGADLEARTRGGMTPYRHALRRGFKDVTRELVALGAREEATPGDAVAVALQAGDVARARALLDDDPTSIRKDNPEETRLLADLAAWGKVDAMRVLLDAGVEVEARGLDDGTALHQAAWFGQPAAARLLLERGARLDVRGDRHDCTPLGWVAHGSRFSGGAEQRANAYVEIATMLLDAGAAFPPPDARFDLALRDATPAVAAVFARHGWRAPGPPAA